MSTDIQKFNQEYGFRPEQEDMLRQPLQVRSIKERRGFGSTMLKYIKGDTAIDTANRIFGFGQWGYRIIGREHNIIEDEKKGKIEYYTCDIELSVAGAAFTFPGDGMGIVTSPFTIEMHEKARKEATTDALKRALRHYGDQFGLCLYNEDDYVDAGDGTLVQVKEVKVGQRPPQPKRVVDEKPALDDTLRTRLNGLFERAKPLGVLEEPTAKGFLRFASQALGRAISHPDQLDAAKLDQIEAEIVQKASEVVQLEAAS